MFSTILLSIISTIIIAAIVSLILYLISIFKSDETQEDRNFLTQLNKYNSLLEQKFSEEFEDKEQSVSNIESEKDLVNEESVNRFIPEVQNEPNVEQNVVNKQLLDKEVSELLQEIEEKDENIPILSSHFENTENQVISKEVLPQVEEELPKVVEDEDSFIDLLPPNENQLSHFNKSRPKKPKSRPSVKIVFNSDSNENFGDLNDNSGKKVANKIVNDFYESNGSNDCSELSINTSDIMETLLNENKEKRLVEGVKEIRKSSFNDESFEQIKTGDYKKFDEFSDYFSLETKRQQFIKKCEKKSQTSDESEDKTDENNKNNNQTNDAIVDELFANLIDESYEEIVETDNSITQSESFQITKENSIEYSVHKSEVFSQKVNSFKLSLSKEYSNEINLSPSKSPLSATLESVTKPLLSSPTLSRKSLSSLQFEDIEEQEKNRDQQEVTRIKRISLPVFGLSQNSIINEMKQRKFQMSLKSQNHSSSNSNDSCDKNAENANSSQFTEL